MIALTSEIPTWAHRVPAAAKFAALFVLTVAVVAPRWLPGPGLALAGAAALYLSCGLDFARAGARALRGIVVIAVIIGLWHWATGAAETGMLVAGRLVAAVAFANFVTMTTRLDDTTALFDRALGRIGLPAAPRRRFALALALAIRFIPVLADKGARLAEAWRARSRRRPGARIVLPMALLAIDDAEQVAEALRARSGGA